MIGIFAYAFNAVAPILVLTVMGYYLRQKNTFDLNFFKTVNRFAFHYCYPCLMFTNLYSLSGVRDINLWLAAYLVISTLIIALVSLVVANLVTDVRNRKGVLIQAGFRSNFAIIGLPLVEGLAGAEGAAVSASMQAPTVISYNILAVLSLAIYSDDAQVNVKKVVKNLISNPLIQGLLAGMAALVIREFIPLNAAGEMVFTIKGTLPWVYTIINYFGRVATPVSLLALGGQFSFSDVSCVRKELVAGVLMRLVMAPVLGFSMAFAAAHLGLLVLDPAAVGILIAAYGAPVAIASAVMATEMKADDVLAGQIVVWTSLISMATVFLLAVVFRSVGML